MWKFIALLVSVSFICLTSVGMAEEQRIKLPADYATKFKNYLSLDRTQNPDQVIRLFANDIAAKGPGPDGKFAEGSVLIAEVYKAKKDADGEVIESALDRRVRDKFALIAVMEKRAGWGDGFPEELRNGDWDFATFKPDGSPAKKDLNNCRACHAPLGEMDHVFSIEHLK